MNILHITDFHYTNGSFQQLNVVESLINTIKANEIKIDLVFFSGDLVQDGSDKTAFNDAKKSLFDRLSKELTIDKENIIFCPGNHDIDRNSIHSAAKVFFESNITSEEKLSAFYKNKKDSMFIDSLKPSNNYNLFLKDYYDNNETNIFEDLYSIHLRCIEDTNIDIICLNSAWISSIDKQAKEDKGNLLIPTLLLEENKKYLRKDSKKIVLVHHPLYFLKEFNFYEVERIIHNEFDLIFSGHVHKISSLSRHTGTNGIFEHVSKASLSSENLGCSIIELNNIEENKIYVKELTCIHDDKICHISEPIEHTIPCGIEKTKTIAFRKKIYEKISVEKENANNLLLLKDDEDDKDFLSLYNHPLLKKESSGELKFKESIPINFEELVSGENNYLILGKDKCGKTSLLKKIQLECLINYSKSGRIPFFFDAREFESKLDSTFKLEQQIRNYFGINRENTERILSNNNFLLLIDNYSPNSGIANYLDKFILDYPNISYIICTEYNLSRTVDLFQFGNSIFEKIFFHDLRRNEIIAYTEKRLSSTKQNKDEIQQKIIQLCKQLELPLNYWTISLLLLIHNKSSDSYFGNLFSVLDVCIDEIFGKKQLLISRSKIRFEQLKTICATLSKHLFINYESTVYSASTYDIINFIDELIQENERITIRGKDVFGYLVSCGILKQKDDADLYVFRLNGFFEYFLALQMTKDTEFKDDILNDESKYLAFKNQLEIYSGFRRDDMDFLTKIFEKTQKKVDPIFIKYNKNKDIELVEKIKEPTYIEKACQDISIKKSLTSFEKAQIEDTNDELEIDADVHMITKINILDINSELIERYLSILARVFRNSDEIIGNKDKKIDIFNQIIDYYCDLGFFIIDEFSERTKNELNTDTLIDIDNFPELNLLKFISNFSPMIAQTSLFDGIGHFNLERMIKNEIQKLEQIPKENQYKLFILYFLLLDIDLNANKEYIISALEKIKTPILKYIIYIKLNYYLAFKAGSNKSLQQTLSNYIQDARLNIDNQANIGEIQRQIQEKKRLSNIKQSSVFRN